MKWKKLAPMERVIPRADHPTPDEYPLDPGEETVTISYYCGYYIPGTGHFFTEPDECQAEGYLVVGAENWSGGCVSIKCPACGAILEQADGHFELAPETDP